MPLSQILRCATPNPTHPTLPYPTLPPPCEPCTPFLLSSLYYNTRPPWSVPHIAAPMSGRGRCVSNSGIILGLLQICWCVILVVLGSLHTSDAYAISNFTDTWAMVTSVTGVLCAASLVPCIASNRKATPPNVALVLLVSTACRTLLGVFFLKNTLTIASQGWEATNQGFLHHGRMNLTHYGNLTFTQAGVPPHLTYVATSTTATTLSNFVRLSTTLNSEVQQIVNAAFVGIVIVLSSLVVQAELWMRARASQ